MIIGTIRAFASSPFAVVAGVRAIVVSDFVPGIPDAEKTVSRQRMRRCRQGLHYCLRESAERLGISDTIADQSVIG